MTCIKDPILLHYLDGELRPGKRLRVEKHLKECTDCTERLELMRLRSSRIKDLLKDLSFEKAVRPSLAWLSNPKDRLPDKSLRTWKKKLIYGVAACALLLVCLYPFRHILVNPHQMIHLQAMILEVDANRPFTDQETVITVIDSDGNVTYMD